MLIKTAKHFLASGATSNESVIVFPPTKRIKWSLREEEQCLHGRIWSQPASSSVGMIHSISKSSSLGFWVMRRTRLANCSSAFLRARFPMRPFAITSAIDAYYWERDEMVRRTLAFFGCLDLIHQFILKAPAIDRSFPFVTFAFLTIQIVLHKFHKWNWKNGMSNSSFFRREITKIWRDC